MRGSTSIAEGRDPSEVTHKAELRTLARGGIVNLTAGVGNAALAFTLTVAFTRTLGPSGSGVLFEALAVLAILTVITQLGATSAIMRPVAQYHALGAVEALHRTLQVACAPVLIAGLGLGALVATNAPAIAAILVSHGDRDAASAYLRWFALALPIAGVLGILVAALRGLGAMATAALIDSVFVPTATLVLALGILSFTSRAFVIGAVWPASALIGLGVAGPMVARRLAALRRSVRTYPPLGRSFGEFWRFATPQSASSLLQIGIRWLDVLLLGALASTHAAGIYGAVSRLTLVGTLPLVAVALAVAPQFSRLFAEKRFDRLAAIYRSATVWLVALSAPLFVIMAFFAPTLLRIFGGDFSSGSTPLRVLAVANLANVGAGPVLMLLLMGGRSGLLLANSAVGLAVNVLLNAALIPLYGATGAAVAWGATIVGINVLGVIQVSRTWSLHPFSPALRDVLAAALIVYGVASVGAHVVLGGGVFGFVTASCLGTLVYAWLLWTRSDRLQLRPVRDFIETRWLGGGLSNGGGER